MIFLSPDWLWALPLSLLLYGGVVVAFRIRRRLILERLVGKRGNTASVVGLSIWRETTRWSLVALGISLLVLALARPSWGTREEPIRNFGTDILFLLDARPKMLADDLSPNRWIQSRVLIEGALDSLQGNRAGLVILGDEAFLESPLSLDRGAIRQALNSLDPAALGTGQGQLDSLFEEAMAVFFSDDRRSPEAKVIVLLSPGEPDWQVSNWVRRLQQRNVVVHTIGTATNSGALLRFSDEDGESIFQRDGDGDILLTRLHAGPLRQLARDTGGQFQHISALLATQIPESWTGFRSEDQRGDGWGSREVPEERFYYFLFPALFCFILEPLIRRSKRIANS